MNKELRIKVHKKYSGKCAYCGRPINYNEMQVDHLHPQSRAHWYNSEKMKALYGLRGDNIDSFENLMPSCRRCNHYKRSHTLCEYRTLIMSIHKKISALYIGKVANDYNLLEFKPFDGKFYFEQTKII